jgi:predicted RNA-binding protein with PUA-like domain
MNYWLFKSEPDCFSIHDLQRAPQQTTFWDGVRNYQARNFLRDSVKLGDRVFYYHSNAEPAAIVGVTTVVRESYPDHTAWNPKSDHFDPAASPENPIWQMVDIRLDEIFDQPLSLNELRQHTQLVGMELLRKGSRLSIQPVTAEQFRFIMNLAQTTSPTMTKKVSTKKAAKKSVPKKKT